MIFADLCQKKSLITLFLFLFGVEMIKAERPMFTDDPNVSPHRVLTLELGNHFEILRGIESPARYINWFDLNFVYGIAENYEITFHIPAGVMIYESAEPARSKFSSADLSAALKRVWYTGRWGFGVEGRFLFPIETTPVLGSDKEAFWINSMADYTTGVWIFRSALGFVSPFDSFTDGAVMAGFAVRTDFNPDYFGFIELYTEAPIRSTDEEFPLNFMIGGGIGIFNDTVFDIGVLVSLTDSTVFPGVGIHAGLTIEI